MIELLIFIAITVYSMITFRIMKYISKKIKMDPQDDKRYNL